MDIPGKMRYDIKRIFGARDPMDFIEDAEVIIGGPYEQIHLVLRVPHMCEKYVKSSDLYRPRSGMCKNSISGAAAPAVVPVECIEKPHHVVFSGPKTILFWSDGSKTMVSLGEDQEYDEYAAFCAAVVKKMFGATHKAKKFLDSVKVVPAPKKAKKKKEDNMSPPHTVVVEEDVLASE